MIAFVLAAMAATQAPAEDPARTAAAAQAMYQQSCQVRAYGSYDDLCSALRQQVREAEKAMRKSRKAKVKAGSAEPSSAAQPTAQIEPATTSGEVRRP